MSLQLAVLAAGLLLSAAAADARLARKHTPDPPKWPAQYQVKFTFSVPYLKRYQKEGLTYHYKIWQDTEHGKQRMERGTDAIPDLETVIEDQKQNKMWTVFVHKTDRECKLEPLDGGSGPTLSDSIRKQRPAAPDAQPLSAASAGSAGVDRGVMTQSGAASSRSLQMWGAVPPLTYVLPDVTREQWKFAGEVKEGGKKLHAWLFKSEPGHKGYGHYSSNYTLTVTPDGAPVKLDIWGINPYTGGHFDHYIARYYDFHAGDLDASVFEAPELCKEAGLRSVQHTARGLGQDLRSELLAFLPPAFHGDEEYDAHVHTHGKRHRSQKEYLDRREIFQKSKRFVQEWNEAQQGGEDAHTVELNRWADVSEAEYRDHLAGNKRARAEWAASGKQTAVHQAVVPAHMLPSGVDWRGTPNDSPVKNQAACGSCWAFGAVGALESAYYRITGSQRLFSEQNLVDCSWDIPDGELSNKGCYDGYQQIAFEYIWRAGGLAAEADYPYVGVSGFCNSSAPLTKFKNGKTVYVKGGEEGLMEALLTKGPMTVAVDAGHESFRFYKSGIYNNTHCHVTPVTDLDHAVIVSGYGEKDGSAYWIVKNTWSSHWGEDGYVRMARKPADCGIATEPLYVEFEVDE